ncbi:MAG: glycosyltransferase family 4 protein [Thermincola sp.]|jgi:glycosyltransferase involved in cell wall biosynthesis|nr:glycosyltransferase family 4 protein [Thermincola sp.]MDT3703449.1 glycosyltransferase family 4 protein [Thermincola sp.]
MKFQSVLKRLAATWLARTTYMMQRKSIERRISIKHFLNDSIQRILHVNTLDCVGGAAKAAFRLNNRLINAGYSSRILVDNVISDDPNVEELLRDNSTKQKLLYTAQQELGWLDFFHLASHRIKDLDIFQQSDLIHLHNLHGGYFSPFALPELTALKPTVWTLHDMQAITGHCAHSFDCERWLTGCGSCPDLNIYPAISKDTSAFLWKTKKKIYAHSNLTIVCPSKWLKDKVERSILGDKDVRLIYNGIDNSVFKALDKHQARKELNLPLGKKILLFTAHEGTGNYWKGGDFVDKAYQRLQDRQDILFLNAGVISAAKGKGDSWVNVPYITDEYTLAKYYSAADLFIYPSLADNCPLVVLESLSCGTPVVAFRTGGIPELVQHMKTGYLADYKNSSDFVHGIKLLLEDNELLSQMHIAAPMAVQQRFTLPKMAEDYITLYKEIIVNRCHDIKIYVEGSIL